MVVAAGRGPAGVVVTLVAAVDELAPDFDESDPHPPTANAPATKVTRNRARAGEVRRIGMAASVTPVVSGSFAGTGGNPEAVPRCRMPGGYRGGMAGYSGTPLPRKLGIKAGDRVLLVNTPTGFELGPLPDGVDVHRRAGQGSYEVIVGFCPDHAALVRGFDGWRDRMTQAGGLWLAWPKKASGVSTDLSESIVQQYGLASGLVDNKGIAIDDIWSGLRFVVRLTDRK